MHFYLIGYRANVTTNTIFFVTNVKALLSEIEFAWN